MQLLADSGNIWQRLYNCLLIRNTGQGKMTPENKNRKSPQTSWPPLPCKVTCRLSTGTGSPRRDPLFLLLTCLASLPIQILLLAGLVL